MKTLENLIELIGNVVIKETLNNKLIKYEVFYSHHGKIVSLSVKYRFMDDTVSYVTNFQFSIDRITNNEIQRYYWELIVILDRHK